MALERASTHPQRGHLPPHQRLADLSKMYGCQVRRNSKEKPALEAYIYCCCKCRNSVDGLERQCKRNRTKRQTLLSPLIVPGGKEDIPPTILSRTSWTNALFDEVAHSRLLEGQMLALTFATGIVDAITYTTYSVFISKQTGNTLFIAVYALGNKTQEGLEKNIAVSFGSFLLGAAIFGQFSHRVNQKRRIWLLVSNMFQTALVLAAAAIRQWGTREKVDAQSLGIITLLAFACGGQIVLAIYAGLPELNTTMITGALIQLCTDRKLFSLDNTKWLKMMFFLALLIGGFVGAACKRHAYDASLGLWLMAGVKFVVGISFLLNPKADEKERSEDKEEGGGELWDRRDLEGGKRIERDRKGMARKIGCGD